MKKLLWSIFILITLLIFIGLTSCIHGGDEERPGMKISSELLVSKVWKVSFFEDNGEDQTSKFTNVFLQFQPNLRLEVTIGCESTEGEWVLSTDSTLLVIRMPGAPTPLDQLNDEWIITKLTESELHIIEQDDKGDEEFKMLAAPLQALTCEDCLELNSILIDSTWAISQLGNDMVNQTDAFKGIHLKFYINGSFVAFTDDLEVKGFWAVTTNCQKLILDWETDPAYGDDFSLLATEWILLEFDNNFMSMEADDDSGNLLRLTKGLFPQCALLQNTLLNTSWYISKFAINRDDVTPQFAGTGLTFLLNNQLATEVVIGPAVLGTWLLAGDCDELILDIQAGTLQELSKHWIIIEISDQLIKLVYEENTLRLELHLNKGKPSLSVVCDKFIDFIIDGSWEVANFTNDLEDETEVFKGYVLDFNIDGSLVILKDNEEQIGSWSLILGCQKIDLDLDNSNPLKKLNESWEIESYEGNEIRLVFEQNNDYKVLVLVRN